MTHPSPPIAALALVGLVTLASCSSDAASSDASTSEATGATVAVTGGTTDDSRFDPGITEPAKLDTTVPEPKKSEPKQPEPKKSEPKRTVPKSSEPKQSEPKQSEPKQPEPKRTEPDATEPSTTDAGTINDTVPAVVQATVPSVPLDEVSQFGGRVSAEITSIDPIEGEARLPGEVAGPALAVHVRLINDSSRRLDVGGVTVTLEDRDGTPSSPLSSAPAEPFTGRIAAGESAEAVYVFGFEDTQSQPVTIGVNYSADEPVALFVGDV